MNWMIQIDVYLNRKNKRKYIFAAKDYESKETLIDKVSALELDGMARKNSNTII